MRRVLCLLLVFALTLGTAAAHGAFHDETHIDHSTCAADAAEPSSPDRSGPAPNPCASQSCMTVASLNASPGPAALPVASPPITPPMAQVPSVAPDRLLRPPRSAA